ncbi:MAG: hypothetical protein CMG60_01755 [Candidatus Marinimicrobia bacterium]|nr:hypothetical protein [Candidatus Neomarinimicrobiota bacterium]|tara:strand:+ start:1454 stop:2470 length:1017 start_codon:yes stop_codon:yes gene_type:complete
MMKTLKLVLTSITTVALLFAGDESRIGTSGGGQVLVPVGARGIALAGSERVYSSGLESIYWNPAGLARNENPTVLASNMSLFNDMGVNYFGVSSKLEKIGSIGFTVKTIDMGDIPTTTVTDMDGEGGGTYTPTLSTFGLTYANSFSDRAYFGITGKVIYESIPRVSASAFALDIGVQYTGLAGVEGLGLALVLNNLGTDLHYTGSGLTDQATPDDGPSDFFNREASYDELPSTFNMALSYQVAGATLGMTYTSHNFQYDELNLGAEYALMDMFYLRGGMTTPMLEDESSNTDETLFGLNFGAGLKYSLYGANLVVDYTMRNQSDNFNASNVFSLGIVF